MITFLLLLGFLVPVYTHAEEQTQAAATPIALSNLRGPEQAVQPLCEFRIPLGQFNICFQTSSFLQELCKKQTEELWNILSPEDIMCLLSWCTIGWYNQIYQTTYAPQFIERQNFINLAQKVEKCGFDIKDLDIFVPFDRDSVETIQSMFERSFDVERYRLLYETLQKECSANEMLILHTLLTPTQFNDQMGLAFEELPGRFLFPTYYSPETLQDEVVTIMESLQTLTAPMTSKQKLFLLLESNLRSMRTLDFTEAVHKTALDKLKTTSNSFLLMEDGINKATYTAENFPYDKATFILPFEALYAKAQELATTGTKQEQALFQLQATPQDYATHADKFVSQAQEENK